MSEQLQRVWSEKNMLSTWNQKVKLVFVLFFFSCLVPLWGCSHRPHKKFSSVSIQQPIELKLKSSVGDIYQTQFFSHTHSKNYLEGQIIKKKDEIVEFELQEQTQRVDSEGRLFVESTTIKKDGVVDLNDLAFPELDEKIEYVYASGGEVLKAGSYPESSIFFVPPIPLPENKVAIGDTWALSKTWVSLKNGIPLQVQVVAILKGVLKCGDHLCADIELSGDVSVIHLQQIDMQFQSDIYGRMLFNINKGVNIWSQIQSREDLKIQSQQTVVTGCMESRLKEPQMTSINKTANKVECQPTGGPVSPPYIY